MQMEPVEPGAVRLTLTREELLALTNALNEVCNGLELWEFETRMGCTRAEAAKLLRSLGEACDQLDKNEER
jgi:hypothetical protein